MRIIDREHIDIGRWDALVGSTKNASFFSYSWYLDACADSWKVLVDDDYTSGIALPITQKAGVQILYTPIFVRYLQFLGDTDFDLSDCLSDFKEVQFSLKNELNGMKGEQYVHQIIRNNEGRTLGSQAKRSIKKAEKEGLKVLEVGEYDTLLRILHSELEGKYQGLNDASMRRFDELIESASKNGFLKVFEVHNSEDKCVGGVFCLEKDDQVLYLKGAVDQEYMKMGGMYKALDTAIDYSLETKRDFDFGGSRIDGVKNVNYNLGGKDAVYYAYVKNDGPFWFKLGKRLKGRWSKK